MFDDNPTFERAFCPPKSAYTSAPKTGQTHGHPLPPLEALVESGKVLALNFPAGLNPGWPTRCQSRTRPARFVRGFSCRTA